MNNNINRSVLRMSFAIILGFMTLRGAEPAGFGFHCGLVSAQGSVSQNAEGHFGYMIGTHYNHKYLESIHLVPSITLTKLPKYKQVSHGTFVQSVTTLTEESDPLNISAGFNVVWKPGIANNTLYTSVGVEYSNWIDANKGGSSSSSITSFAKYINNTHQINPVIGLGFTMTESSSIELRLATATFERPSGQSIHGTLLYLIASFH